MKYATQKEISHNVYFSMKPVLVICKFLGLNPYGTKIKDSDELQRCNYYTIFYFVFFFLLYTTLTISSLVNLIRNYSEKNGSIYVTIGQSLVLSILLLLIITFSFFRRSFQIKAFTLMSQIDIGFIKYGFPLYYPKLLRTNQAVVYVALISLFLRITVSFTHLTFTHTDLMFLGNMIISAVIKTFSKYQCVAFLFQIKSKFLTINTIIKSFYKDDSRVLFEPKIKERISEKLYNLCRLHFKSTSVLEKINSAFAAQLLASIGASFFGILFQSYHLYDVTGKWGDESAIKILWPFICLVDETVEIYWLVYASAGTCDQANETPILLHELRNYYFEMDLENDIQTYSLQMLHQKVQFSVLGFFVVDYTLISSIVGAVTTYLVIFIQFDQTSYSEEQEAINSTLKLHASL